MIWQDDSVGGGKVRDDLVIVHEAVDQCDPRAVTAALNQPDGQVPAFPGLADDRQPVALHLLVVE